MPEGTLDPLLTHTVEQYLADGQPLNVLDAGCGRMWTWDLGGLKFRLTGIDTDEDALRLRVEQRGDLDEWVADDLRTVELEDGAYDLVHSAYVLEHVDGAELVLERMAEATRPGGLMVVRIPDRGSVYSFLTRLAPHGLHVLYKRHIRKRPNAGKPGYGPYPVVYDSVVSLPGITEWAHARGVDVVAVY
ncbi:MAG TPA: class I SAM-dependent methyltransferase, partial [Nocardioidaceae bacterium]|nr:class I SAM-dependent methyltransferase [Nocardioidaceae bacterium]